MLRYIENSIEENVTNETIQAIHAGIQAVKQSKEVGVQYLKTWEREAILKEEGREEGTEAGRRLISELIRRMIEDGRADDVTRVVSDETYQEQLLKEYGLI